MLTDAEFVVFDPVLHEWKAYETERAGSGEKFDWDAFYKGMENYNEVTRFHLDLWEINRTKYPQVTGPTPWLWMVKK